MLKKGIASFKKFTSKGTALMMAFALMLMAAVPASANADLDAVTTELVDGADSMKTNALLIIGVCIAIFIVVFGIGWLMSIFKKKMSKAG